MSRDDWPLLRFVRSVRRERDLGAGLLASAMACYAALALALATVPGVATYMMERFHLRTESFVAWALLQPYPWMYNFENAFAISTRPLTASALQRLELGHGWRAINHHSARAVTFVDQRAQLLRAHGTVYVYLVSRYREREVLTAYRLRLPETHGEPGVLSRMEPP